MDKRLQYLEDRVQYLEEVTRFALDTLEMAASLGDFQSSINKLQDASIILDETRLRVQRLINFNAVSFYLVDENTSEFSLSLVHPVEHEFLVQEEVESLIDNGSFAWALREKKPVIVSSKDHEKQLILHVMATSSRIRGMFVGVLEKNRADIPDITLSLLSIILLNSSNALESFELYKMIREISKNLETKENYKVLFEAAPDGVAVVDARGNIVDCNEAFQNLVGFGCEDMVGKHATEFLVDNYRDLFESRFLLLKKEGFFEGEAEIVDRRGSVIPVWSRAKAIYEKDKSFVCSVVYSRDISLVKQAEKEKEKLQAKLQRAQKMEALGTLAGGVAHDLNNVLVGLVGYPELMLMQIPEESKLRKHILSIQKSGEKAAAIVQDLLTLARRGVALTEVVDLNRIISDYLQSPEYERLRKLYPDISFETGLEKDLLNVVGTPVHLSKTLMNLVHNAAEAISGPGKVIVSTKSQYVEKPIKGYDEVKEGNYAVLTVSDTGEGIAPNDIERIFEPFYTKKVMGRSGTGLGLAVVWGTVKDHGGYIDVRSAVGVGTTFKLYFPGTRKELKKNKSEFCLEDHCGHGETILIVDDVEEQREIASEMLNRLGYSVTAVSSGEEAMEFMKKGSADLLILDMIMDPGLDGLETYRNILKLHPRQKAIIVSGFSETERVKEARKLGVGAYIKKPFLFETLGEAVRDELRK
ncbi:MAG: response regulator [Syntrophobacteraceae bacterium]